MSVCTFFRRHIFSPFPKQPFYKWQEPERGTYILNPRNSVTPSDYLRIYSEYLWITCEARITGERPDPGALVDVFHHLHGYALCTTDVVTAHSAIRILESHGRFRRIADIAERGREETRFTATMILREHGEWDLATDVALSNGQKSYIYSFILSVFEKEFDSLVRGGHYRAIEFLLKRTVNLRILEEGNRVLERLASKRAQGVSAVPPVPEH